jgi:hypothetical protein
MMKSSICYPEDMLDVHFYWPLQFLHASYHSSNALHVSVIKYWYSRSIWSCHCLPYWYNLTCCRLDGPLINTLSFQTFYTLACSTLHFILSYSVNVYMILLNTGLNKVHVENLAIPTWVVFSDQRPFVKWKNAECTNVSCFTALPLCHMLHFTLSCRILLVFPTSSNFVQFMCVEISVQSAWRFCLGPLGVGYFSGHSSSSELELFGFWTSDSSDLATTCPKFLFVFVFCIQKCTEGSTV